MDDWQTPASATLARPKPKRAFVGNLTPSPSLETKLKGLFLQSNIAIHKLDIIKPKVGSNCFALVECDVEEAIKCLNGIPFQGNKIVVQREKKQLNARRGGKNGSAKQRSMNSVKFGGGWAKPMGNGHPRNIDLDKSGHQQKKIHQNAKLHSGSENNSNNAQKSKGLAISNDDLMAKLSISSSIKTDGHKKDEIQNFHERCKLNINQLMEEYGEHDPDFENMKIQQNTNDIVSSNTYNDENNSGSAKFISSQEQPQSHQENISSSGMLAPNGNAPIDVELVSFGYKYSVPPQARQGWSHSNPLSPIDCRNLPRCPHYVAKLSGLSYKVKKALLSKDYHHDCSSNESINSENDQQGREEEPPSINNDNNPLIVKSNEISLSIFKAIEEAINEGNHGYAFPLQSTVFIGSEYGRHRSVVLCENIAVNIRKLLRANEGDRIGVPVSICVRHRDVDKHHRDGEAFGDDLRREHEIEVKRKKKQEWLENRGDNTYW